jgi:hypothetical protein
LLEIGTIFGSKDIDVTRIIISRNGRSPGKMLEEFAEDFVLEFGGWVRTTGTYFHFDTPPCIRNPWASSVYDQLILQVRAFKKSA